MSADEARREHDAAPSRSPPTAMVSWIVSSRSVPVMRQLVADELETNPGQHGQRPRSARRGSSGSGQRVGEDITFATELHGRPFPIEVMYRSNSSNRGCGLWTSLVGAA